MNEFISLINKYTGSSISLLNTDDIITKSLYNQIANILNNVSDVDDKNIHYHDYYFKEANLSLLDDDTPLKKSHFINLSHALLYLRYWEKD
jgi:hypothetical protein